MDFRNIFISIPGTYHEEDVRHILSIVRKGESMQLISPSGSGKSVLLRSLSEPDSKINNYHLKGEDIKFEFIYLDLNLAISKETDSVLEMILSGLNNNDTNENYASALDKEIYKNLEDGTDRLVIIFDGFDNMLDPKLKDLYRILKGLSNKYKNSLCYLFSLDKGVSDTKNLSYWGELGPVLSENIVYLKMLSQKDAYWFIDLLTDHFGIETNKNLKKEVYTLSGGYPRTIKRIIQHLSSGGDLEKLKRDPSINIHLTYHFEQILLDIGENQKYLKQLVNNSLTDEETEKLQNLKALSIVNQENTLDLPLFSTYLSRKFKDMNFSGEYLDGIRIKDKLTPLEHKTLLCLLSSKGSICTRDEIAEYVWGDDTPLDVTNHAIDQIVHRLRKKLAMAKPGVEIETARGRGYSLSVAK